MKKIIILERQGTVSDCNYCFWLEVPAARQAFYVNTEATSTFKNATIQEIQDIKDGKVKEVTGYKTYEASTTAGQVKADLISMYNSLQDEVDNYNPWIKYGSFWDGSSWTVGGVS